jgi:outer membrane biosynthesis protein TonB
LASLLATGGIENGAARSFAISLAGHLALAALLFFLPSPGKKIFVEEIPRSVKLIATLDMPPPPAPPARAVRPVKPKPKPKVVQPSPPPKPARARVPTPAPSRVKVPVKETPPLVKPRRAPEAAPSLREKLASRLSDIDSAPPPPPKTVVPDIAAPKIATVSLPSTPPPLAMPDRGRDLVPLSDFPYSWYITVVKQNVYSRWKPPSSFVLRGRKTMAVASFRIMKDGRILQPALKEGSGHRLFDQSAMAALTALGRLPVLPPDYKEDYLDVVIRFQNPNR